jgi:tRNA 5-methylaminomethyl-2-thiouridine biosynthesis bifunctional protein
MQGPGVSGLLTLKGRLPQVSSSYLLDYADIDWQQQTPYSRRHQDIYWSRGNPIDEKAHVFIDQHRLAERGRNASQFTIVETGFGFGNNFLLTASRWRNLKHRGILNYIAIENSPVSPSDLSRHYEMVRIEYSDWLLEHYPLPLNTSFVLWLEDNIRLLLIFDNATSALENLSAKVDAWYLDGFSPAKNTDLWNPRVYGRIFSRSKPGATLSTYTVAGQVRQDLGNAGFTTSKISGFGAKAEMLAGCKPGNWEATNVAGPTVAVIGSGVAGMGCTEALKRRNLDVEQISYKDPNAASNIPQFAVYPQLGANKERRYQFSLTASAYTQHRNPLFHWAMLRWHSANSVRQKRMLRIAQQFPDEFIRCPDQKEIHFLQSGWLSTAAEEDYHRAKVGSIKFCENQWQVSDDGMNLITQVDHLVIAAGIRSSALIDAPLIPVRGQALTVRLDKHLSDMMDGDLIVIPATDRLATVGSTFEHNSIDPDPRSSETSSLLDSLRHLLPGSSPEVLSVYVGIRAATRDRLPLVGLVPGHQRLYLCTGFGSHGATNSRLCGEFIANLICDEPAALNRAQQAMLAVDRFQLRDSRKYSPGKS